MSVGICESHFKDNVDSFIVVSSDSDFWGTISSLPDANFMVVYENEKSSDKAINVMESNNVVSCCLDSRIVANEEERNAFYNKYLKNVKVSVDNEGNLSLKVG